MYFLSLHPAVLLKGVSHARLPPMWPGFESWHWRHMWVEFVVGFLLCSERFFSGCFDSVSPLLKNNIFNSNSIWNAPTRFHEFLRNPKCSVEAGDLCYKKDQSNCVIHWKEIYPVDSAIHRLSNCCLVFKCFRFFSKKPQDVHLRYIFFQSV